MSSHASPSHTFSSYNSDRHSGIITTALARALLSVLVLLFVTSCSGTDSDVDKTPTPDVLVDDETISAPREGLSQSLESEAESRQVVIWAPDFWAPSDETPAGQVLSSAITQFEQINTGIKVEVQTKAQSGEAGMYNYLRSAQEVAPAVLPDAVLLDTQDLWRLVELGMVQPLTDTISLQPQRFYPFTLSAVRVSEELYGIPYATDIIHAASFGTSEQDVPAKWSELPEDGRRYLFPAAGLDGDMSLLLQYVGVGGELFADEVDIDEEALTRLFEFYATGVEQGMIPPETTNLATMDAVWASMATEGTDIVDTTAGYLLRQNESPESILYAHSPTEEGQPVSVSRTWAFVVLTSDPGQRTEVFELIQSLLEPSTQGQWSQFAKLLPTTPAAAETWNMNQPYYAFLIALLDNAYAVPNGRPFTELLRRMQTAQQEVLSGRLSPEEAVTTVRPTP